jgi:hypothetical protein
LRTARKEAEAPGAAAPNATQGLYYEGHYLVALIEPRVVVVALEEGHVALAHLVVKRAIRGHAALAAPKDLAVQALLGAAEGHQVAHMLAVGRGRVGRQARGHLRLPDPVGAPRGGTRLDQVGDVALVVLFVLVRLLLVAEQDAVVLRKGATEIAGTVKSEKSPVLRGAGRSPARKKRAFTH